METRVCLHRHFRADLGAAQALLGVLLDGPICTIAGIIGSLIETIG